MTAAAYLETSRRSTKAMSPSLWLVLAASLVLGLSAPPDPTPVAWWPLDGTGADAVGRNPATVHRATPVADRHGRAGGALAFDGSTAYLAVPSPRGLRFDLRFDSYTIALWVRSSERRPARLVQKWDDADRPYPFALASRGTGVEASLRADRTTTSVRVPDLWDGAWHHVAVTFEATPGVLTAYRDGVRTDTRSAWISSPTTNVSPLWVGTAAPPVRSRFFAGALDDLRLYDRALPAEQIAALAR